jgi:hypothetical protein
VIPHPPVATAAHSPLSSSSPTQHVSSSTGSKTSPSSSSSPPITPSLSFGDSSALGNPSRSGALKTANAPIARGQNVGTSPTSHSPWVAIARGVAGAFSFFLLAIIVVFCIQQSPSQVQQNSICTFLWSYLAFRFFHVYLIVERQVCTCIKFVFGNMSDWARKKPELWMEKLLISERCRGKGREGIDDVVLLCSFSLQYCIYYCHPSGYHRWRQTRSL